MLMVSSSTGLGRRATLYRMRLVGDVVAQLEKELPTSSQLSYFDDPATVCVRSEKRVPEFYFVFLTIPHYIFFNRLHKAAMSTKKMWVLVPPFDRQ